RRLAAAIVAIRSFSPSETVILADNWLPVRYYLPAYPLISYPIELDATTRGQAPLPPEQQAAVEHATALVWFEATLDRYNSSSSETRLQPMAVGTLRVLRPYLTAAFVDIDEFGLRPTPR
ncbi:MAG: hypothetical protein ACJ8CR_11250, partial [Roseiflexaceae bacterium]